jgi:ATP-dependent DNA helicase RecQ
MQTPDSILKKVFGYEQFQPLQREIIENVLERRDTLVIMPTGGGKSLCYQIPALLFPGLTVVVSPLIALMKDQVEQLRELGVAALFLNSSLSLEEYRFNVAQVRAGKIKLLYVAPETLLTDRLLDLLAAIPFDCLAIDEAHCISEWGHDFRPEYWQLAEVRQRFPRVVCLALTATATPRVREDIQASLRFEKSNEFIASFDRANLLIEVVPKDDPLKQTLKFLKGVPGQSGIIYCFSRKQVDELADVLAMKGYAVRPYHAGLSDLDRKQNQELFIRDDAQIIVATIAFGMGINKPNVRFIIHFDLPKSIESYYQEIGRAGRDGLPAHCVLLFGYGDLQKLRYFIDQKEGAERQVAYQHLGALTRYAESESCRRVPLLAYFGEAYTAENCGMCDRCLAAGPQEVDVTVPAQKLLSCVVRTGERFGAAHVSDVLMGSGTEKVRKFNHQTLSTFGIGKDLAREQWMHLARQLVQKGLLSQDDRYGSLKLTARGYEALRNREIIQGTLREPATARPAPRTAGRVDSPEYDQDLFDLLRRKRKELADVGGVPPYVIFSDRTLVEMAAYLPQSTDSLLRVHGVGSVKMQRYGTAFLEIIQDFCARRGLAEKPKHGAQPALAEAEEEDDANLTRTLLHRPRHVVVGEAYNQGQTITALMAQYSVKRTTILDHLTNYALEGHALRESGAFRALSSLPETVQEAALAAFQAEGARYLKPVFDRLNGAVDYDELRIMRLCFISQANGKPPPDNRENA